jgi:hypothetical protein
MKPTMTTVAAQEMEYVQESMLLFWISFHSPVAQHGYPSQRLHVSGCKHVDVMWSFDDGVSA